MEMFQSNIYYYVRIKGVYCVYTRIVSTKDVPRRTKKKLTNLSNKSRSLCMHKILVHAQHSCACTTLLCMHWRGQGPRPRPKTKKSSRGSGPGRLFFLGPALVPGTSSACTRVLCMHKSIVHAQESCACTRISINKPLC